MAKDRNGKPINVGSMVRIHWEEGTAIDKAQVRQLAGESLIVERDTGGEFRIVAADICEVIQ